MKLTKRKSFQFLRSYFDVLNNLQTDKDKLNFLLSIIDKSFLDEEPKDLDWIVQLCYDSQRHSIEKSLKGWKSMMKTDLLGKPIVDTQAPYEVPYEAPCPVPYQQEEEEEEEEEEVQVQDKEEEEVKRDINFVSIDSDTFYPIKSLALPYLNNKPIMTALLESKKYGMSSHIQIKKKMEEFLQLQIEGGTLVKKRDDFAKHFRNWLMMQHKHKSSQSDNNGKNASDRIPIG